MYFHVQMLSCTQHRRDLFVLLCKRGKKQLLLGNIRYYFGVECETLPSLLLLLLLLLLLHARPEFEVGGLPLNERAVREGEKERERERKKEREGARRFHSSFASRLSRQCRSFFRTCCRTLKKKYQKSKTVVWNLPKIVFDCQTRFILGQFSVKFRCCPFGLLVSSWSSQ